VFEAQDHSAEEKRKGRKQLGTTNFEAEIMPSRA